MTRPPEGPARGSRLVTSFYQPRSPSDRRDQEDMTRPAQQQPKPGRRRLRAATDVAAAGDDRQRSRPGRRFRSASTSTTSTPSPPRPPARLKSTGPRRPRRSSSGRRPGFRAPTSPTKCSNGDGPGPLLTKRNVSAKVIGARRPRHKQFKRQACGRRQTGRQRQRQPVRHSPPPRPQPRGSLARRRVGGPRSGSDACDPRSSRSALRSSPPARWTVP